MGRPSCGTSAYDNGSGVCETSAPRILKVHATACESDNTSASTPSFAISRRIRFSFSSAVSPEYWTPCREGGASGGGGRSVHPESPGLLSTATSSARALAQAAVRRSAADEVCSHGSNPSRSPAERCLVSQLSGGG